MEESRTVSISSEKVKELDKDIILKTMLNTIPKFKDKNQEAFELGYGMI